ncbi:GDP/GTP exchange factor for ARF, partial [Coemansia helicoidea]
TAAYDRELLAATWPRFLRSLARTLAHFGSDHTLRQALSGLYALVGSAAHYGLTACVDEAVVLLADMAGLGRGAVLGDLLAPQVLTKAYGRYAVLDPESPTSALGAAAEGFAGAEQRAKLQEQEQASVQVTQAALEFGSEYRAQIAFVALFELATRFADAVSGKGWAAVLDVVRVAVDADLVPHELRQIADPAAVGMWIPRIPTLQAMDAAQLRIRARQLGARNGQLQGAPGSGGLLMAISSLWGGGGSGDGQMSPGRRLELRWRAAPELLVGVVARGRLAVQASAIGELGAAVGRLDQSLPAFLAELARLFPQPPPSQPETPADGAASGAGGMVQDAAMPADEARPGAGAGPSAHYTPSSVFCLELAVALVLDAPARAGVAWPPIEAA